MNMSHHHGDQVVILDDWEDICRTTPAVKRLQRRLPVTVYNRKLEGGKLHAAVADASIIIPIRERTKISHDVIDEALHLKLIAQTGAGTAHIDISAAKSRGIAICLTPGGSSRSVAELVLGMALAFDHRIVEGDRLIRNGIWKSLLGRDILGQTLGLLGFGATARAVAPLAVALGLEVTAWSRSLGQSDLPEGVTLASDLSNLLATADILSIHLPMNQDTRGFLDARRIGMVKPGALLINTSRGPIIDTKALVAALDERHLRGACLDVFDPEPLPSNHELCARPDVVLTPHVGWTTADALHRFLEGCEANILAFLAGKPINILQGEPDAGRSL